MVLRGVKRKLRNACAMQREGWEGLLGTIDSDGDGEVTLLEVGFLSYEMYSNLYAYTCVCVCVYHVCVCVCNQCIHGYTQLQLHAAQARKASDSKCCYRSHSYLQSE
jgi:hypothetical protein